jgi:hypothetical protein
MGWYGSRRKPIISVNSINQLIFVMETRRAFFAIRTEFLNIIQMGKYLPSC